MECLPKLCEVCDEGDKIYKCPRCGLGTCSLKCCIDHKRAVSSLITAIIYMLQNTTFIAGIITFVDWMRWKARQNGFCEGKRIWRSTSQKRLSFSRRCFADKTKCETNF